MIKDEQVIDGGLTAELGSDRLESVFFAGNSSTNPLTAQ